MSKKSHGNDGNKGALVIVMVSALLVFTLEVVVVIAALISLPKGSERLGECAVYMRILHERVRIERDSSIWGSSDVPRPSGIPLGDELEHEASIAADFGGLWVADDARIKVGLVERNETEAESRETIRAIATEMGLVEQVDFVPVNYSWTTLVQTRDAITRLSDQYIGRDMRLYWPIRAGIRTGQNRVSVYIPEDEHFVGPRQCQVLSEIEGKFWDLVVFDTYGREVMND